MQRGSVCRGVDVPLHGLSSSCNRFLRLSAPLLIAFALVFSGLAIGGSQPTAVSSDPSGIPITAPPSAYVYRNFSTIKSILIDTEAGHPGIAKVYDIGDSWETTQGISDRDILAVKISDNVLTDEDEPEGLIMALHHAREWVSAELVTELILNLTSSYGIDPRLTWLVDNREIWIIPVVNPDGLEFSHDVDPLWRKNRRLNWDGSYGVDLNRNYNGSENGDPLGAWGGAGASHTPSSTIYCGEHAFSEPETIAIRDLTYARDFQIAFDIHSYSELVMWPWGYTANKTPDDASLVSIGTKLAAINGYTAAQSIDLYATTGDSLDWLYGGAHVYSILFEIGKEFQPDREDEVRGIIHENMPALVQGIEFAGDRDLRAFEISHTPVPSRAWSAAGHTLEATVTADRGVDASKTKLVYRVNAGVWTEVPMDRVENDSYKADVPAQSAGALIEYYFVARDLGDVHKMSPAYAPYQVHSYAVTPVSAPPVADAGVDRSAVTGVPLVLDGSKSHDDVGIVNFTWSFVYDGEAVELHGVSPEFTFEIPGTYIIVLTVFDAEGQSDADEITVTTSEMPDMAASAALLSMAALGALIVVVGRRSRRPPGR